MEIVDILPWQDEIRNRISDQFFNQKLPHAFLFEGPAGVGKFEFALELAQRFLCDKFLSDANAGPCGSCAACLLIKAGTHSDLRLIQPVDSKQIKIDQIRDLILWVSKTSLRNGLKITIVEPAEQMNQRSANALLKCLEEPAPNTMIMLLSSRAGSLLPTIRSRCQTVKFTIPSRNMALDWLSRTVPELEDPELRLDIADGILGLALSVSNDDLEIRLKIVEAMKSVMVEKGSALSAVRLFKKPNLESILLICATLLADCVKLKLTKTDLLIKNKDLIDELGAITNHCNAQFLISAYERIGRDLKSVRGQSNPNESLLFESLMIDLGRETLL